MKTSNVEPWHPGALIRGHVGRRAGSGGVNIADAFGTEVDGVTDIQLVGASVADGLNGVGIVITNTSGSSMVPYYIAALDTFTVPLYKQALYNHAITLDGALVVNGILIFVS